MDEEKQVTRPGVPRLQVPASPNSPEAAIDLQLASGASSRRSKVILRETLRRLFKNAPPKLDTGGEFCNFGCGDRHIRLTYRLDRVRTW